MHMNSILCGTELCGAEWLSTENVPTQRFTPTDAVRSQHIADADFNRGVLGPYSPSADLCVAVQSSAGCTHGSQCTVQHLP